MCNPLGPQKLRAIATEHKRTAPKLWLKSLSGDCSWRFPNQTTLSLWVWSQALSWELQKVRELREAEGADLQAQLNASVRRNEEMEDDFEHKTTELVSSLIPCLVNSFVCCELGKFSRSFTSAVGGAVLRTFVTVGRALLCGL